MDTNVKQCSKWKSYGRPAKLPSTDTSQMSANNITSSNMILMSSYIVMFENDHDCWYVNNGAYNHVAFRKDLFQTFQPFVAREKVTTTNGDDILIYYTSLRKRLY